MSPQVLMDPAVAAHELLFRRNARRNLIDFITYTLPRYIVEPFHLHLAAHLDKVSTGELRNVMVFAPPQHGKSQQVSRHFPAFCLGKNPEGPIIMTSYASSLAHSMSRDARNVVESKSYRAIFDIRTDESSRAVDHWRIDGHRGALIAAGVGGPITGHGAVLGIIDDPIENYEQAQSDVYREKLWNWYQSTFYSRIWEGGRIVIVNCLPGNVRIMMDNNTWRPLDTILPGEKVKSWNDGKLVTQTVEAFIPQGKAQVVNVKTGHYTLTATKNHPLLTEKGEGMEWVHAGDLKKGDRIVTLGRYEEGRNPRCVTEEDMWALGYMLGDGWITHHPRKDGVMRWATCVSRGVYEGRNERILSYFESKWGVRPKLKEEKGYYRTEIAAAGRWFESLGLIGKAKTKRIPDYVFALPVHLREVFLEGFIAADGWIDEEYDYVIIGPANDALINDLKFLAASCGYRTKNIYRQALEGIQPPHSPKPINSFCCRFGFSLHNRNHEPFVLDTVRSVSLAGVQSVYDLTISETHNFIAEGIVTKNTRWHEDDLCGRLLQDQPERWLVLRYPALAETQEERDEANSLLGIKEGLPDTLGRKPGEPLCPSRFSKENLEETKATVVPGVWYSLYQGSPRARSGNRFQREWFQNNVIVDLPERFDVLVRYWDKASSVTNRASYTCGVLMGKKHGTYFVLDVKRGKWTPSRREQIIKSTATTDKERFGYTKIFIEQEPGSGGKDSVISTIKNLAGFTVKADKVTGSKETRSEPYEAQCRALNVKLHRAHWNWEYIEELAAYPSGRNEDQVDASSGAFNKLASAGIFFA